MDELSLFSRLGLTEEDRADCHDILNPIFPKHELTTHKYQGYCSYTVRLLYQGIAQGRDLNAPRPRKIRGLDGDYEAFELELERPQPSDDFFWNQSLIVQFRPPAFALDIQTAYLARTIYGGYAPSVRNFGQVCFHSKSRYQDQNQNQNHNRHDDRQHPSTPTTILTITAQSFVPGIPYSATQVRRRHLSSAQFARQENLVRGFAAFLARSWLPHSSSSRTPIHLPLTPGPLHTAIPAKLALLSAHLPSAALRAAARQTLAKLHLLQCLPLSLNHGDMVPGNVMVGTEGELMGLVDWAEAEVGVWGVPLYGVEFLLGWVGKEGQGDGKEEQVQRDDQGDEETNAAWGAQGQTAVGETSRWTWTYYTCADSLRHLFWAELARQLGPRLAAGQVRAIHVARDVGVLLWFGFAWDEGDIGRVVDAGRDARELCLLEAFLGVRGEAGLRGRL